MTTESQELKPCPFCGGEAEVVPTFVPTVRCSNAPCPMQHMRSIPIAAWNTRQEPSLEALKGELPDITFFEERVLAPGENFIAAKHDAALTKAEAAEVIRRAQAYESLKAENARLRELLGQLSKAVNGWTSRFDRDGKVERNYTHTGEDRLLSALDATRVVLDPATPPTSWLASKLRDVATRAAEAASKAAINQARFEARMGGNTLAIIAGLEQTLDRTGLEVIVRGLNLEGE